jgi:hypothetical protein
LLWNGTLIRLETGFASFLESSSESCSCATAATGAQKMSAAAESFRANLNSINYVLPLVDSTELDKLAGVPCRSLETTAPTDAIDRATASASIRIGGCRRHGKRDREQPTAQMTSCPSQRWVSL